MSEEKNAFFDIDSRLLVQLGENLVTNRAIALAELVKNSYDADAKNIIVRMYNIKSPSGTIIVEDDGSGMDSKTFLNTWMRIATNDKDENPISKKFGRKKSGEKGIGRFACRILSKKLTLISISEKENGTKEELKAVFDWTEFIPNSNVNNIPVKYFTKTVDDSATTGTTLVLEITNEAWNEKDIKHLRNELTELISPSTFKPIYEKVEAIEKYDPGIDIIFDIPEFTTREEKLEDSFFKNSWAKVVGSIDDQGFATYEVKTVKKIMNDFTKIFRRSNRFRYLKNVSLEVYILMYAKNFFGNSDWRIGIARDVGEERGGIKVYIDNFRVFGYGTVGDDWLNLDYDRASSHTSVDNEVRWFAEEDKRPGLRLFRRQNLFGHVVLAKKDNNYFEITANRERLVENEAFEELTKFVRLGVDFATVLYSNEVYKKQKEKKELEKLLAKNEAEKRRIIEEEKKLVEEEIKKAEDEKLRVEREVQLAENARRKVEEERRKIEESRRKAEKERREVEQKIKANKIRRFESQAQKEYHKKAKEALKKEQELLEVEEKTRTKEQNIRTTEEKIKRKAKEDLHNTESFIQSKGEEKKRAEEELKKLDQLELQREKEKYRKELSILRVLASSGTIVLIFGHELGALVQTMEEMRDDFSTLIPVLSEEEQNYHKEVLDSFNARTEMVKELTKFFGLIVGKESRSEKKKLFVNEIIDNVFRPFKLYFEKYGVKYSNTVPENLRTPFMYRSELTAVVHNLMSNAFKAVKGNQERYIEVTGFENEDNVHIQFLDSGSGLEEDLWEVVFEPFESYSEPDDKFGTGTGLGLKIVRDIIRSYEGDVKFVDAPASWKTCVDVMIPCEMKL